MNILISCNQSFLKHAENMIFSIHKNNNVHINIYLLYTNLEQNDIVKFQKFLEEKCDASLFCFKVSEDYLNGVPVTDKSHNRYFGKEAYFRLYAQFILPEKVEKILYLDIDIICNGNLQDLYNEDFNNKLYIGCYDLGLSPIDKKRIGLIDEQMGINSGVLLINLKELRKKYSKEELTNFINEKSEILEYPDQDIINMLYYDNIKIVDNKYNYAIHFPKKIKNVKDVTIIHYSGSSKPWSKTNYKINVKLMHLYCKYLFLNGNSIYSIIIFLKYIIAKIFYYIKRRIKIS